MLSVEALRGSGRKGCEMHFKTHFSWFKLVSYGVFTVLYVVLFGLTVTGTVAPAARLEIEWTRQPLGTLIVVLSGLALAFFAYRFVVEFTAFRMVRRPYTAMRRLYRRADMSFAPKILVWGANRYTFSKIKDGYSMEAITESYRAQLRVYPKAIRVTDSNMDKVYDPTSFTSEDVRALAKMTDYVKGLGSLASLQPYMTSRQADTVVVSDGVAAVSAMFDEPEN